MKLPSVKSEAFREWMFILVGILLVLLLYVNNKTLKENGRNADGGRAMLCLQLKAAGQPVTEYGPCMKPAVYVRWKDEPIATLNERLCASGNVTEGC